MPGDKLPHVSSRLYLLPPGKFLTVFHARMASSLVLDEPVVLELRRKLFLLIGRILLPLLFRLSCIRYVLPAFSLKNFWIYVEKRKLGMTDVKNALTC